MIMTESKQLPYTIRRFEEGQAYTLDTAGEELDPIGKTEYYLVTRYPSPFLSGDLIDEANHEFFRREELKALDDDQHCIIVQYGDFAWRDNFAVLADKATAEEWREHLELNSGIMDEDTLSRLEWEREEEEREEREAEEREEEEWSAWRAANGL